MATGIKSKIQKNCVGIMDIMVKDGNWDTATRHEDALIMNTFYYKVYTLATH